MIKNRIQHSIHEINRASEKLREPQVLAFIESSALLISERLQKGNKVLVAGNGGSLCDAMHFAEELTGNFRKHRQALPAIALSDPGHITCTANDFGFEWIFSRHIEALGKQGDVFIGLTTSGNSPNLINAFEAARKLGLYTLAFLGKGGGKLKGIANLELSIDDFNTSDRIQEAHMSVMHVLIEAIECILFPEASLSNIEPALRS